MIKFDIGFAFSDAIGTIKKGWRSYLINYLLLVGVSIVFGIIMAGMSLGIIGGPDYTPDYFFQVERTARNIIYVTIPFTILLIMIQANTIKITDDLIEKREHSFTNQIKYTFKRFFRILMVNFVAIIPAIILILIALFALTSYRGIFFGFLLILVLFVYVLFITFIDHAIIIDDCKVFEALNKSFDTLKASFFRYAFTMIAIGISNAIIGKILDSNDTFIVILSSLISGLITLFICVLQTVLYKQINTNQVTGTKWEFIDLND